MPTVMDEFLRDEMDREEEERMRKEQLAVDFPDELLGPTKERREEWLKQSKKEMSMLLKKYEILINNPPKIKVKKLHPDAVLPKNAHEGDAGYDLVAIDDGEEDKEFRYIEYKTGIAIQVPNGYHTCIYPRSSISKYDLVLANSIGLIDEIYRGEVVLRFKVMCPAYSSLNGDLQYVYDKPNLYKKGDKIGQLVIVKTENMPFEWAEELDKTERGQGGFGSSGK